jgi:hypothetical protein
MSAVRACWLVAFQDSPSTFPILESERDVQPFAPADGFAAR